MPKLQKWIDASKNDIRLTWTGPKAGEAPADASLVDGWPFDPPDEFPGWHMVDFGISDKDDDLYWVLWVRAKTPVKKKRKARKQAGPTASTTPAVTEAPAPAAPKPAAPPRTRKPKPPKKGREEVLAGARARLEEKQQNEATPPAAE